MPAKLTKNDYGKGKVRLTKVTRFPDRHELREMWVTVTLRGDFADTYLTGDNSKVVATDSMKNTVYVLAKKHPIDSIEEFAADLGRHFVKTYPQVASAGIVIRQANWLRMTRGGNRHPYAFVYGGPEARTCFVNVIGDDATYASGVADLIVLKTTDSGFTGFVRDDYTTLPETTDRILATRVKATWNYDDAHRGDWNEWFTLVRQTLLDVFAEHKSLSVQQTLYAMGETVIATVPQVSRIDIMMPNEHRIPFNFAPLGLSNDNDIFVPVDEPFGFIRGTIARH